MEQRTQEWLDARKGRVTASIVGAILGHAPYMKREDALRRMVRDHFGAESEFNGNPATDWGVANESGAIAEFTMETGLTVEPAPFVPYEDWAGASPDGYVSDGSLIEIKCPYSLRNSVLPVFKECKDQPHYYDQVQFQLLSTGKKGCHFYQWAPGGTKHEYIALDPQWVAENVVTLKAFYGDFLKAIEEPSSYLEPKRVAIDTPEAVRLIGEYDDLVDAMEQAKARQSEIIERLSILSEGRNAVIAGRNFTLTSRAGSISYAKAFKELVPDADLEKYRGKETEFWRLF